MNSFVNFIPFIVIIIFLFVVPLTSLIIWFRTKDPKNHYLKKLYKVRFYFGIFALVSFITLDFIFDRYNLFGDPFSLGFPTIHSENIAELIGRFIGRYGVIYLLFIRKWVK